MPLKKNHEVFSEAVEEYVKNFESLMGDKPKKVNAKRCRQQLMIIKKAAHEMRKELTEYEKKM